MKSLFSLILALSLAVPLCAQDETAHAKSLIRDGKCADAIAPLQKISKSKGCLSTTKIIIRPIRERAWIIFT